MKSTVAFTQLLMLSTSLLCLSSFAAQKSMPTPSGESPEMSSSTAQKVKSSCKTADNPHRFEVKHIESKGIGYNQGYTSLDAFFTGNYCNFIPFIDLRAHVFNNGKWASNAGIGTRYVMDPCKSMVGVNAYYDYRSTKHFHYNQVGAGIEAYYDRFEFLANGYLPLGRKRMRTRHELESIDFKRFSGNYILYNKYYQNKYEGAMKGFNAEVGTHFAGDMKEFDLYFGIGPYYYDLHKDKSTWGGKARLKMELSRFLFVELSDSWDHIFHNRFQVSANVSVPFGVKKCYGKKRMPNGTTQNCSNIMDWLATLPVDRQEIIVVDKFKKKQTIDPVAIDPATGQPFYVVFVNNLNPTLGVGTFENPFSYLSNLDNPGTNAEAGSFPDNTIYVFPGDGTNARMARGMVLQEKQRMLGSGMAHTYVTTDGVLVIPAQTGKAPFITGTIGMGAASAVLIDVNNCEVSGFNIAMQTFPAGSQILVSNGFACIDVARNASVTNTTITNNALVNESYGVLFTQNAQGNIVIKDNIISMHEGRSMAPAFGIGISFSANAHVLIENNDVTFNPANGGGVSSGIVISMQDQVQTLILNNRISNMSGNGILMGWNGALGATGTCIARQNDIRNITGRGIQCLTNSPTTTAGSLKMIIEENSVVSEGVTSAITLSNSVVANPGVLVRFNGNTMPNMLFDTGAGASARLWVEPPVDNNNTFSIAGTAAIIPVVPCQYGGPECP